MGHDGALPRESASTPLHDASDQIAPQVVRQPPAHLSPCSITLNSTNIQGCVKHQQNPRGLTPCSRSSVDGSPDRESCRRPLRPARYPWLALAELNLDPDDILEAYPAYAPPGLTSKRVIADLQTKILDPDFRTTGRAGAGSDGRHSV